jgi:hypothetical protein
MDQFQNPMVITLFLELYLRQTMILDTGVCHIQIMTILTTAMVDTMMDGHTGMMV